MRCDFFSDTLAMGVSMTVILPQRTTAQIGMTGVERPGDPPVLYLLHGLSDDDTTWARRTSIERYVAPLGLAVVMPQVHRSFYANEQHGLPYWAFLTEELPALVGDFFRVSQRREDTFVAGLSMGGYGAMKWALRRPGTFAAAASLSGALDVAGLQFRADLRSDVDDRVFGNRSVTGTRDDLFAVLDTVDAASAPMLSVHCGTDDPLIESNRRFAKTLSDSGIRSETTFGPGAHDWAYWDAQIQAVLDWLPLDRKQGRPG